MLTLVGFGDANYTLPSEDEMFSSEHRFFGQSVFEAFYGVGSRLSLVVVLLATSWFLGCAAESPCIETVDVGVCRAIKPQVSDVRYGDRALGEQEALQFYAKYVCAHTSKMEDTKIFSGEFECLDPNTPFEEWGSPDWAIEVAVTFPRELCACDEDYLCRLEFQLIFDKLVEAPKAGSVFDLTKAKVIDKVRLTANIEYAITGGTVEFVTVEPNKYSLKIHDLTLTGGEEKEAARTYNCYNPETVTIESISFDCIPNLEAEPAK